MSVPVPSKTEVYEHLRRLLVEEFGFTEAQIVPTTELVKDLDLDSIDWINMAVALEVRTGHKLQEEDLTSIRTIQDVVDVIHHRLETP